MTRSRCGDEQQQAGHQPRGQQALLLGVGAAQKVVQLRLEGALLGQLAQARELLCQMMDATRRRSHQA